MISSLHNSRNKNLLPPEALRKLDQWVCWRWEERPGKPGQFTKVPYEPLLELRASVDEDFTWGSFQHAVEALENNPEKYDGLGFVFDKDDDLCGVDFDDCIDPATGEIDPNVLSKVDALDSYTEISPSKTGLKVFCKAKLPGKGINKAEIEMYDSGRYFTFTGNHLSNSPSQIKDAQEAVDTLYEEYAEKTRNQESRLSPVTTTSHEATLSLDDERIIEKARLSGNGHKFMNLFDKGNIEDYKSQSEAELALCSMLAFWTGRDADRIAQLFRHSALWREKWERHDYRSDTISRAIEQCAVIYGEAFEVSEEVLLKLQWIDEHAAANSWKGRSGATDRAVHKALCATARTHGKNHPEGVVVSRALRDIAPDSGISRLETTMKSLRRLEDRGWIKRLEQGKKGKASTFLLLCSESTSGGEAHEEDPSAGTPINRQLPKELMKIRYPACQPTVASLLTSLLEQSEKMPNNPVRKFWSLIIEKVAYSPDERITLQEIATLLERKPHNLRPVLKEIVEAGLLLEVDTEAYAPPEDLADRLERKLQLSGSHTRELEQRSRYAQDRADFNNPSPTDSFFGPSGSSQED